MNGGTNLVLQLLVALDQSEHRPAHARDLVLQALAKGTLLRKSVEGEGSWPVGEINPRDGMSITATVDADVVLPLPQGGGQHDEVVNV